MIQMDHIVIFVVTKKSVRSNIYPSQKLSLDNRVHPCKHILAFLNFVKTAVCHNLAMFQPDFDSSSQLLMVK